MLITLVGMPITHAHYTCAFRRHQGTLSLALHLSLCRRGNGALEEMTCLASKDRQLVAGLGFDQRTAYVVLLCVCFAAGQGYKTNMAHLRERNWVETLYQSDCVLVK